MQHGLGKSEVGGFDDTSIFFSACHWSYYKNIGMFIYISNHLCFEVKRKKYLCFCLLSQVYPSEIGLKCMKEEEQTGPRELAEQVTLEDVS